MQKLFKCYDLREGMELFSDKDLDGAEFPDWLAMLIVNSKENYKLVQWTGGYDENGQHVYEEDIVRYKGKAYRVFFPGCYFALDLGEGMDIPLVSEECEVIGNTVETPERLVQDLESLGAVG